MMRLLFFFGPLALYTPTIIAAPVPAPVAIAAPNRNSLHAPTHALAHVLESRYVVEAGTSVPESCDGDDGLVKCRKTK